MLWFFIAPVLVCMFWGLVAALVIKAVKKTPKMPTWPIVTGLLLGLIPGLLQMASDIP
jgi:hypothetical protein